MDFEIVGPVERFRLDPRRLACGRDTDISLTAPVLLEYRAQVGERRLRRQRGRAVMPE
jgi:hypothetical protein